MQSTDTQIDLVLNRIKRTQYEQLALSGLLDESQLYLITDDPTSAEQISSQISASENRMKDYVDQKIGDIDTILREMVG